MKRRTKRLFLAVTLMCCAFAGWAAVNVLAWIRDLPNRIVFDGDAAVASVGEAVTDYYHQALRNGDSTTRLHVINEQFVPMINEHTEAVTWIRDEYREDIRILIDSEDPRVSDAASDLIARLDAN